MYEGTIFGQLDQQLQQALHKVGYKTPTPIQAQAIPRALEGRDILGSAQTGTGKTAAFLLPILHHLLRVRKPRRIGHPRALILSPTRELAAQTAVNLRDYSQICKLPFACIFGGVSQFGQVKDIKKGAETLIACPGRLIDLMTQGIIYLDQVEIFVLDEADRMLDMGFLPDIKRIISKLPRQRQTLFFSATFSKQIRELAGELVTDPIKIEISPERPTVEKINQKVMFVEKENRDALLVSLMEAHPEWDKVIVFTKMRHGADRLYRKLSHANIAAAALHSDKTQGQRTRALEAFRRGDVRVLVATDIASRGIDVPDVKCVINTELPLEIESYVHRIGRTARAGESGAAISFVTPAERNQLKAIERFIRMSIPVDRDHPFHSLAGDRAAGKTGEGLPTAPWIAGSGNGDKRGDRPAKSRHAHRGRKGHKPSSLGHRQPDFRQKRK